MIINKQILDAHDICGPGYDYCRNVLGDGTDSFVIDYSKSISAIQNDAALSNEEKLEFLFYTKELKLSVRFYELQNKGVFMNKYHVFNPVTGQYEHETTLDAAKILQEKIQAQFLAHHAQTFVIQQELFIEEENRSLWKTVE